MPIGSSMVIPYVVEQLSPRPASVLDLGVGFGMNGALVRQYCDRGYDWHGKPDAVRLTGVEGFRDYENPVWHLYDRVFTRDIAEFVAACTLKFDLILMTDVLEHFTVEDGRKVLEDASKLLAPGGRFLVSTPGIWIEQGAVYGNEFETHRSLWTPAMLEESGFRILWDGTLTRGQMMLVGVRGAA